MKKLFFAVFLPAVFIAHGLQYVLQAGAIMSKFSPVTGGLIHIHKVITRGLGVSIKKCDEYIAARGIPPEEAGGFYQYVTTLARVARSHHLGEDDIAFPYFKNKLEAPYGRLSADHRVIAGNLSDLDKTLSEKPSIEGVVKLRGALAKIQDVWVPHIKIEESSFSAEKLNAAIGKAEQQKLEKVFVEHGMKSSGPGSLAVPFMMYNLEGEDRRQFAAGFPWIVRNVLVPFVWRWDWKPMQPFLAPSEV